MIRLCLENDIHVELTLCHSHACGALRVEHHEMVIREQHVIDLTADEVDGDPSAVKVEEPDHLLCPITGEMLRDPVILVESGHTYERAAIERHLRVQFTDPRTRIRIATAPATNWFTRDTVQAWLNDNPGITPGGWDSRELLAPSHPQRGRTDSDLAYGRTVSEAPQRVEAFHSREDIEAAIARVRAKNACAEAFLVRLRAFLVRGEENSFVSGIIV